MHLHSHLVASRHFATVNFRSEIDLEISVIDLDSRSILPDFRVHPVLLAISPLVLTISTTHLFKF